MSNDTKSKSLREQANKSRKLAAQLERSRHTAQMQREKIAFYKKQSREREKELRAILKKISGKGIYDPKGKELTKYRKHRLENISKEFGNLFDPKKFVFIKPDKKIRKKVLERTQSLEMKTTRLGFFTPKEGAKNVNLKYDAKRDEHYIVRSGKTKWGNNKGKVYRSITPLASVDELDKERDRIRNLAGKLGPIGKDERLAFEITERGNEGFSHATFGDIDLLLQYLENYRKTTAAKVNFFRHIKVVKTTLIKGKIEWFKLHPPRAPKSFGRRIHTSARPFKKRG